MSKGAESIANGDGVGRREPSSTVSTVKLKTGGTRVFPIVITGGAGFIGSNLAHRLLSSGHRVMLIDTLARPGVEKNLEWLINTHGSLLDIEVADVRDMSALRKLIRNASHVFHFAAQVAVTSSLTNPLEDFDINARGTLNLLETVRSLTNPPKLLLTSTNKVYGNLTQLEFVKDRTRYVPRDVSIAAAGINESRSLDFHSPYGCSKGAADQYVLDYARTYRLPALVFRMSCIYGPHQYGNEDQGWVAHFLIRSLQDKPITIYGDGLQVRDILFVDDLVDAMLSAQQNIEATAGHAFNIGGGPRNTVSLLELLDLITEVHGRDGAVKFESWRAADQRYYVADNTKFQTATGWEPRVDVREGIRRLYQWLKTESGVVKPKSLRSVPMDRAGVEPRAVLASEI